MPPITPAVAKRRLDALLACAENPRGLQGRAFSGTLPTLEASGLVTRRSSGTSGRVWLWFLTPAGREALAKSGRSPDRE